MDEPKRRGRRPGSRNKATIAREMAITKKIKNAFPGDAHAYLISVYKDEDVPIQLRIDAAKAAARYEKPQLQTQTVQGNDEKPVKLVIEWQQSSE